jgi:hypothetical protein
VQSTTTSSFWLLRASAVLAALAAIAGVIVAPGLRGNAGELAVHWADAVSAFLAFVVAVLLIAAIFDGVMQLFFSSTPVVIRSGLLAAASTVVLLACFSARERLPGHLTVLLACGAAVAAFSGGAYAARTPHTRAIAGVLFAFAFATLARVGAWIAATRAGDSANMELFGVARNLATTGVALEAAGQVIASYWLARRSRAFGQLAAFFAVAVAVIVTRGVAEGGHADAAAWQAIAHSALGDPPGVPPAARLAALATMLVPSSMLLALGVTAQPGQLSVVVSSMALALVSRGAFDAPLRALCVVTAAQWAVIASLDEKVMWTTLLSDRKRRLAEDGLEPAPPPGNVPPG